MELIPQYTPHVQNLHVVISQKLAEPPAPLKQSICYERPGWIPRGGSPRGGPFKPGFGLSGAPPYIIAPTIYAISQQDAGAFVGQ